MNCSFSERLAAISAQFFKSPRRSVAQESGIPALEGTRERILAAARDVFSRQGREATVREICAAAGVNVSAVNYYFGGKDRLYAEVLNWFLKESFAALPYDGGVSESAPAEERLYGMTLAFLSRILLAEDEREWRIIKMVSDAFVTEFKEFEPYAEAHRRELTELAMPIVREVSGRGLSDRQLEHVVRSFFSQIFIYSINLETIISNRGGRPFSPDEVAALSQHVTAFCLGGMKNYWEYSDEEKAVCDMCGRSVDHGRSR